MVMIMMTMTMMMVNMMMMIMMPVNMITLVMIMMLVNTITMMTSTSYHLQCVFHHILLTIQTIEHRAMIITLYDMISRYNLSQVMIWLLFCYRRLPDEAQGPAERGAHRQTLVHSRPPPHRVQREAPDAPEGADQGPRGKEPGRPGTGAGQDQ